MIFHLVTPPQEFYFARARPIHVSNSHTKVGWISSNGLGGDSITGGRTYGRSEAITISLRFLN